MLPRRPLVLALCALAPGGAAWAEPAPVETRCEVSESAGFHEGRIVVRNGGAAPVAFRLRIVAFSGEERWESPPREHELAPGASLERAVRPFQRGQRVDRCGAVVEGVRRLPPGGPPAASAGGGDWPAPRLEFPPQQPGELPPLFARRVFLEHSLLMGFRLGAAVQDRVRLVASFDTGLDLGDPQRDGIGLGVGLGWQFDAYDALFFARLRPRYRTWLSSRHKLEIGASLGLADGGGRLLAGAGARLVGGSIGFDAELLAAGRTWPDGGGSSETTWTALLGSTLVLSEGRTAWMLLGAEAVLGGLVLTSLYSRFAP